MEFHKYQMMETLGLHTNAELIHFAIKHGLVELGPGFPSGRVGSRPAPQRRHRVVHGQVSRRVSLDDVVESLHNVSAGARR